MNLLWPVGLSVAGAYGVYLLYTAVAFGWGGIGVGPTATGGGVGAARAHAAQRIHEWLALGGLADVRPAQFAAVMTAFSVAGGVVTFGLFGGLPPSLFAGLGCGLVPVAAHRNRGERRRSRARDSWPRLIEEIRLLTGSIGMSIPQALVEAGRRGPEELRTAFRAAEREWLISTDFGRTIAVLKDRLADPTADVVCETLLVAYEVGGSDLDRRLAALAEDRIQDLQCRKEAAARQSGVRFARRFVLIVPLGMAVAGLSIGAGRDAYRTSTGQVAVLIALVALAACWLWAGRLLRLPEDGRVFDA